MAVPIQKLAVANLALIAYYILPNLTTFVLTLLTVALAASPQFLTDMLKS
jgi:hypothetical protein